MIKRSQWFAGVLIAVTFTSLLFGAHASEQKSTTSHHYLLVWAGDRAGNGNDFLIVINADPESPDYGRMITTLATDQRTVRVHHTEYTMPDSGMLFANDHDVGRTFIFDVRNPLQPKIVTSFYDLAGYMHPHSYLRLPNGHVLATFQHAHHSGISGDFGRTGGLVEISDAGAAVRAAGNADPAFPKALLMPYGLVVIPEIDRVVSTNSSMHDPDIFSGVTYTPEPTAKLVYTFPGNWCGVPTIVGHYFVQSVPAVHGLIVLSLADPAKPVEVSRLTLSDNYFPHWTGWDPKTRRLVVTSSSTPEERMYLLRLDETTGALSLDPSFRDTDAQPGFSFNERDWPHGWRGAARPHGAVFTR